MRRRLWFWGIVFLLAVGCGRKAPPLSPEAALPIVIEDLQGVVREEGVLLSWTTPSKVDATEVRFRLYRREEEGRFWRALGEPVVSAGEEKNTFLDREVEEGYRYRYGVRVFDQRSRWIGRSNEVVLSIE